MTYTVITEVADPETGGNLALCIPYVQTEEGNAENGWIGRFEPLRSPIVLQLRVPVFTVGEILILDASDRDQFGRKPGKWDVRTETFDDPAEAVARALAAVAVAETVAP